MEKTRENGWGRFLWCGVVRVGLLSRTGLVVYALSLCWAVGCWLLLRCWLWLFVSAWSVYTKKFRQDEHNIICTRACELLSPSLSHSILSTCCSEHWIWVWWLGVLPECNPPALAVVWHHHLSYREYICVCIVLVYAFMYGMLGLRRRWLPRELLLFVCVVVCANFMRYRHRQQAPYSVCHTARAVRSRRLRPRRSRHNTHKQAPHCTI